MSETPVGVEERLGGLLEECGQERLAVGVGARFADYFTLLRRWNARVNLTAIREEEGILSRHFVEGIACARALPRGIGSVVDFGSGGGFPGIPIALCRPEIAVTLAESQGKKVAFLREAVRVLGLSATVHGGRAEALAGGFDCVTLRAVDRMEQAVAAAGRLVRAGGWLAVMTTGKDADGLKSAAGTGFSWEEAVLLPGGDERVLLLGRKAIILPVG